MKKFGLLVLWFFLAVPAAQAAVVTKEIPYKDGDVELTGYFAYDDQLKEPAPGILVVHEWWGLNNYAKKRAEQLAAAGYAAFAVDMYGTGKVAANPDDAKKLSGPFYEDRNVMRRRALAGLHVLKTQMQVNPDMLAAIGYCFGGSTALELARAGTDLKGVVSFHGGLATTMPAKAGEVKARVLVLGGKADTFVSEDEKKTFLKEMTDAGVNLKAIEFPGATHAFTNPEADDYAKKFGLPIAYNKEADKGSWDEMMHFFSQVFRP